MLTLIVLTAIIKPSLDKIETETMEWCPALQPPAHHQHCTAVSSLLLLLLTHPQTSVFLSRLQIASVLVGTERR